MLCEKCKKNEATGYYEGTNKGVKTVIHLCTKCLLDKQKELFGDFDMFSGFVGNNQGTAGAKNQRCSKCGTDLKSIAKTLFVGCPQCYGELSAQLNPIIKNIQGTTTHVGYTPMPPNDFSQSEKSEIERLKQQLSAAIVAERFEDAAIISSKLKSLSAQNAAQSSGQNSGYKPQGEGEV